MAERKRNTTVSLMGDRSFRDALLVRVSRVEKGIKRKQHGIIK